jgi:hypothetical protein
MDVDQKGVSHSQSLHFSLIGFCRSAAKISGKKPVFLNEMSYSNSDFLKKSSLGETLLAEACFN